MKPKPLWRLALELAAALAVMLAILIVSLWRLRQ